MLVITYDSQNDAFAVFQDDNLHFPKMSHMWHASEAKTLFNLNVDDNVHLLCYEPTRNIYHVLRNNESQAEGYESPDDNPMLKQIHSKRNTIIKEAEKELAERKFKKWDNTSKTYVADNARRDEEKRWMRQHERVRRLWYYNQPAVGWRLIDALITKLDEKGIISRSELDETLLDLFTEQMQVINKFDEETTSRDYDWVDKRDMPTPAEMETDEYWDNL